MKCEHCCYSCTEQGCDISEIVFERAGDLCLDYDEYVTIGGGEPTVHPLFIDFLREIIRRYNCESDDNAKEKILIVTNGKITEFGMLLAYANRHGIISCELSQDCYHDEIDERVVKAFGKSIRDVSGKEIEQGRQDYNGEKIDNSYSHCVCDTPVVKPWGVIHLCGCENAMIVGDVFNGFNEELMNFIHNNDIDCQKHIKPSQRETLKSLSQPFERASLLPKNTERVQIDENLDYYEDFILRMYLEGSDCDYNQYISELKQFEEQEC
jgi:hypothetical protein